MAVSKRLEPVVLVPREDVEGGTGVIAVTTSQTKIKEVSYEMLKDTRVGMLCVISRYIGR